jgi:hypothetical protein
MLLREQIPLTSDQAVPALMALDILHAGVHPVFYYGATYAGTLEPHYLALVFQLFGASVATYRAAMGLLVALLVVAVGIGAGVGFGERAGWLAAAYLALGPSYFIYKGLTSDGNYVSLLLLLALALLSLLHIERARRQGAVPTGLFVTLGLVVGLAWWVTPLVISLAGPGLVAVAAGPRAWLNRRALVPLAAAFLAGSAPWWIENLRNGFLSLRAQELTPARPGRVAAQLLALFTDGLPVLLGGRSVWAPAPTFPGAPVLALGLFLALLGFGLWLARRAPTPLVRFAAALALSLLVVVPVLSLVIARTDFGSDPRYLLPAYLGLAPLAGAGLDRLWRQRPWLAVAATALLLALGVGSQLGAKRFEDYLTGRVGDTRRLAGDIEARGVGALYTSYWMAHKITFLTAGRVVGTPFGLGMDGLLRNRRDQDRVDADPAPGFLLTGESARQLAAFLAQHGVAHQKDTRYELTLFYGLPPGVVATLRGCRCLPSAAGPGDIVWLGLKGPDQVPAGQRRRFEAALEARSEFALTPRVALGYRWRARRDPATLVDGGWAPLGQIPASGGRGTVAFEVLAGVPPGVYDLIVDLVDPGVAWFAERGIPPVSRPVEVLPAG